MAFARRTQRSASAGVTAKARVARDELTRSPRREHPEAAVPSRGRQPRVEGVELLRFVALSLRSKLTGPLVAACIAAGCGGREHPPELGDTTGGGDAAIGGDSGSHDFGDGSLIEKSCGLGPDGGVCACADEPLVGDPPTLYFVLDRSGSMNDSGKWTTVQITLEKIMIDLGPRAKVGAAVFPDPARNGCAPGIEVFPPERGDAPAGTAGSTELGFLELLGHISAQGGTPTAATLRGLTPHIAGLPGKTYVILATDGGPNCDASATCAPDMCTYNIEDQQGCPPGGPADCCSDPKTGGPLACLDAQPTIDAVTALAQAGIPVYVVGVPGSTPYANLLDQVAVAGGTARGSEPQYYAVDTSDQAALYAAMSKIAARIAGSCILTLNQLPPDPSLLNVFFDGKVVPQSGPDGWTLNGTIVTILGASCDAITAGDVLDVRVEAGCPTVTL